MREKITAKQIEWLFKATTAERVFVTRKDFMLFFVYYFAHYVKAPFADFHYDMGDDIHDLVDGKIKELGWFEFRESAKTSLGKGMLSWVIAHRIFDYVNVDARDKSNSGRFFF